MADDITINHWINDTYGTELNGMPRFRVSWTTGQLEKRKGKFSTFYGHIFIREEHGIKEVPKYPFDKDRWVLEKLEVVADNPEMCSIYSYEPMHIFKDVNGKFLALEFKVVKVILFFFHNRDATVTKNQLDEEEAKSLEVEIEEFRQKLGERMSDPNQIDLVE